MVDVLPRSGDPRASLAGTGNLWIYPPMKTVFVSVAKNACTSLKWTLSELAGENLSGARSGLKAHVSPETIVHNRAVHKRLRSVEQLDPEVRGQIHPDNGWFVFAVVRDPRARLFSAWQEKLLMRSPSFERFYDDPWFPKMPTDGAQVIDEFRRFVDWAGEHRGHKLFRNTHFRAQTAALNLDVVPYSRIYEISEMSQLRSDLLEHVRAHGWVGELPRRRPANDTPLRPVAALFDGDRKATIESIYAADFERFGDRWDFAAIERNPPWSEDAVAQVRLRAEFGLRVNELRGIALRHKELAERSAERVEELSRQLERARKQSPPVRRGTLPRRLRSAVRSRMTRAARRVRQSGAT